MSLPASGRDRAKALAAPLLLATVALVGVVRSATLDQSSWQGASFGMFATYDNDVSRTVVVTASLPDDPARVALPSHLHDDARQLQVVPTDARARRLAQATLRDATQDRATRVHVAVLGVRLQDDGVLTLRFEQLASGEAQR